MSLELELITAAGVRRVVIEADRSTAGTAAENDLVIEDGTASRLHAMFERFPAGWLISDLDSSNGTWLNGERILTARRLNTGDQLRIGQTRIIVASSGATAAAPTVLEPQATPMELTRRERDVLVSLCRPLLTRDLFTEPASTRAIAEELVITQPAVKQHLANLYAKFEIGAADTNRRMRLANAALRRGSVTLSDLRPLG